MPDITDQVEKILKTTKVIPLHTHNGTDSLQVMQTDINGGTSVAASGSSALTGAIILAAGTGLSVVESGQTITYANTQPPTPFGGTGADGALTTSSVTISINLNSQPVVVKNYTSISITGTGNVVFTNPAAGGTTVYFRSQGNVTITSSAAPAIDLRLMGGIGGQGGSGSSTGNDGTDGDSTWASILDGSNHYGVHGQAGGTGAAGGAAPPAWYASTFAISKVAPPGAGGGGGGGGSWNGEHYQPGSGGNGGNGGGSLIIECAGAYDVTGTLDLSGQAGTAGGNGANTGNLNHDPTGSGGGGGGGGGGSFIGLVAYGQTITNSGTYTVLGGVGGSGGQTPIGGSGGGVLGSGTGGGSGSGGSSAINPGILGSNGIPSFSVNGTGGNGGAGLFFLATFIDN